MLPHASDGNMSAAPAIYRVEPADPDHGWSTDSRHARTHLNVQRLIADLAARFVTVGTDAIDSALCDALQHMGDALHLDQAILWTAAGGICSSWIRQPHRLRPGALQLGSIPVTAARLLTGKATWFVRLDEVADPVDRSALLLHGIRSAAFLPIPLPSRSGPEWGGLALCSTGVEHEWTPEELEQLRLLAGVLGQAFARRAGEESLQRALRELQQLRDRPETSDQSRPSPACLKGSRLIVSASEAVRRALMQVEQVAPTPATVLLLGETGVGKQVFAQAIHELSPRRDRPMIHVNCGAIPTALIESELFGRERGAYTGAVTRQIGRFEAANHSTILLDEIGELPSEVQVKLLCVLQERVIERLGSVQSIKVDVRIIAATNRNMEKAVEEKAFREDLFYRLNVFPIVVPPLRERIEDIRELAWEFIDECSRQCGKSFQSISRESMRQLEAYSWPGNVRELRNVIERAVILAAGPRLEVPVPRDVRRPLQPSRMTDVEVEHIRATLESANWRIRGEGGAAERLGLKPTTLESRMARLGIVKPCESERLALRD